MSKRNVVITVIVGLLAIGGGILFYIQQTLKFAPLPTYNTTIISGKPEGTSCINKGGKAPLAIELIDLGKKMVYLAGGENPITVTEWDETTSQAQSQLHFSNPWHQAALLAGAFTRRFSS